LAATGRRTDRIHDAASADGRFKLVTGEQSRTLGIGERICWAGSPTDPGTVTETNWAGVTIKWNNRSAQAILHNDMAQVERVLKKI
jgi:hypothetical protein